MYIRGHVFDLLQISLEITAVGVNVSGIDDRDVVDGMVGTEGEEDRAISVLHLSHGHGDNRLFDAKVCSEVIHASNVFVVKLNAVELATRKYEHIYRSISHRREPIPCYRCQERKPLDGIQHRVLGKVNEETGD